MAAAIKRNGITVMAAGCDYDVTETDCVIGKSYETSVDQMQRGLQLRIARESGRFIFSGLRRLMRANNTGVLPRTFFGTASMNLRIRWVQFEK